MLSNIEYQYIYKGVYSYSDSIIKKRYYELNEKNKLNLDLQEYEEFKLLQILIEMNERSINYSIIDQKVIVEENNKGENE